jgi:lipoprotein-anchoring transpeptidase ErfK/SrfK
VVTDASGVATGGWVLDGFGGLHAFGTVPSLADPVAAHPGHDVWQKLHLSLDGQLYGVGRYGIVSAPGISPSWNGYQDYGNWNAIRDVVIANPMFGGGQSQPVSAAALNAFTVAASSGIIAKPGCGAYGWVPPAGKWIVLSLECQELSAYQDGRLLQDMLITTGRPALPTERGHTHVLSKNHPFLMISTWPRGSPYYYNPSWVQYVTWIWPNGTGIHDAYWEPNSGLGPGSTLGPYASHGCIHVTLPMAQWIYYWADVGTPVDVV